MNNTASILKAFLASPGDVKPERQAAEELVNEMNKYLRNPQLNWQIALYMWEDAIPTFGRPQETINADVDQCDVFIGLLWEKWGQQTGKYSSGFEEEFERALARRKASGQPEIWLVFKHPNPEKMKDPGADLSRVLEFQKTQRSLQEVFYHEIPDCEAWKAKLNNWLWTYISKDSRVGLVGSVLYISDSAATSRSIAVELCDSGCCLDVGSFISVVALTRQCIHHRILFY